MVLQKTDLVSAALIQLCHHSIAMAVPLQVVTLRMAPVPWHNGCCRDLGGSFLPHIAEVYSSYVLSPCGILGQFCTE